MANPDDKLSRRMLLRGAAVAVPAGVLAACGGDNTPASPNADITVLNALLTREYSNIVAYNAGIRILMAPPAMDPQTANAGALGAIATQWVAHHTAHANALKAAIMAIGGTPVSPSVGTFSPDARFDGSVGGVLKIAANAEKDMATSCNNTMLTLNSAANRFLVGTIEGDETQHFVVLYSLLKGLAGPGPGLFSMGTGNVVPKAFVARVAGDMATSLQDLTAFTYT